MRFQVWRCIEGYTDYFLWDVEKKRFYSFELRNSRDAYKMGSARSVVWFSDCIYIGSYPNVIELSAAFPDWVSGNLNTLLR